MASPIEDPTTATCMASPLEVLFGAVGMVSTIKGALADVGICLDVLHVYLHFHLLVSE